MILKIVSLFLVFMAVLAMFGRLRLPRARKGNGLPRPRLCKTCGRYMLRGERCSDCDEGRG